MCLLKAIIELLTLTLISLIINSFVPNTCIFSFNDFQFLLEPFFQFRIVQRRSLALFIWSDQDGAIHLAHLALFMLYSSYKLYSIITNFNDETSLADRKFGDGDAIARSKTITSVSFGFSRSHHISATLIGTMSLFCHLEGISV